LFAGSRRAYFRVALIVLVPLVVIIVIVFAVALVFLFVFGWLLSKEDIGSYRPIKRVGVGTFWMYSAHVQWYAPRRPWP
jgi:hypothetical protein